MRKIFKPVDILSIAFILFLSAIVVVFSRSVPKPGWLLALYFVLIMTVISLAMYDVKSDTWKPVTYLHAFLPVVLVSLIFNSLGDIIPFVRPHYYDDLLIRIDYLMFGANPTIWLERFIHPVLTDILQFAYISYYLIPLALGIVLIVRKRYKVFDEAVFGIVLCFYLSYIGYILVPAVGPRYSMVHLQTTGLDANYFILSIQRLLNLLEHNKTDAFPSGHTAIALMTVYYAWKSGEKGLNIFLIPLVCALMFSTVYLRYHYVIDVIAGVALTAITILIAPRMYRMLDNRAG
ncbi:undecaprenyl pyrophosphate phosphatase [bacterium BMS3Abin07]|nr:undecaprenyl pyrophosphate phosphatase [bacterium BMS3Abin07]GBE32989.1 undecaprenyl pyrophosphate phosphatase [bacterium BMS3Bbin05]HDL19658.1 phosphatase PAP2 family protein [Nitrospirota bacterium]HDO21319.1 phosphatase PAP2 family protein [Nitrospirota bacterium]HDZ88261.1 phosphatase PAP2 family protein [Nitrospirota bacterium]